MQTEGAKMMLEEVPVTFVQKKYNYEAVFSPDGTEGDGLHYPQPPSE